MTDHHDHPESPSLALDLAAMGRRRALLMMGGAVTTAALVSCGGGGSASSTTVSTSSSSSSSSFSSSSTSSSSSSSSSSAGTCTEAATETNGPYPADGTNTISGSVVNVLTQSGIVRSDIRTSFGAMSGTAAGVPLTLTLTITIQDANLGCTALTNYAVYIWHCDRAGLYSLYSSGVTAQNYLRGVQVSNASGQVTFTTIFPACYSGRMPHIHVEVYASQSTATTANNAVKITQLAFDRTTCQSVYNNATGYSQSISNLAAITFASDNVFSDDTSAQLAAATVSLTGDYTNGFTGTVSIAV